MNRERRLANYVFAFFSAASLALLSLPLTGRVQALKACVSYLVFPIPARAGAVVGRFSDAPQQVVQLLNVDTENRRLREEIKETLLLRQQVEGLTRENERLEGALGLKPENGKVLRWARVIEREPANWHRSILVDAGSEDGVELNCPVLGIQESRLGIVGRVTEVGPRTAKVLLLTDELSAVAAYLPSSQWEGLLHGQGTFRLRMDYLPMDAQFAAGDAVYTSPTSAVFPPDLLIGTVTRVFERDPFLAFQSVEVSPAVQAATLKEVMLISRRRHGSS